ncbi:hypothetical protein FEZ32_03110 [Acidipropionibacterium jensenii]|nr:hypothetical protein FEZ32_03110 [Acidipropionibacterium jensenii]
MWRWDRAPWRASPRLICALTGGDGAEGAEHAEPTESTDPVRTILVSDERWTCGEGPVRFDSMYEGETYDDRRSPSDWGPVAVVSGPGGALVERPHEPVSAQTAVEPQWRRSASGWIGDVGQMMAGVARYDLPLETGQQVSVRFGEKLDESGELVCANEHIYTPRFQTDVLIGAGRRLHWQPEFSYKGFQYLSVEGLGRRPAPGEILAVPLVQQVRRAVEFECDVPIFTQLVEVMRTTVLNNLHHIPTTPRSTRRTAGPATSWWGWTRCRGCSTSGGCSRSGWTTSPRPSCPPVSWRSSPPVPAGGTSMESAPRPPSGAARSPYCCCI